MLRASTAPVLGIVVCGLAACAGSAPSRSGWPAGDARVLVGHGEGATTTDAHTAALADLAAQVRAEVRARTERVAAATAQGGQVQGGARVWQSIDVDASLPHGELAWRRWLHRDTAGRTRVVLLLVRADWAARRRADAAGDARVVLGALDALSRPSADAPSVRWHDLGRAVASARRWLAAEREAAAVGGHGEADADAARRIEEAITALERARDDVAHRTACVVSIDGSDTVGAVTAAACGAETPSPLLGRRGSDARTLAIAGRVERALLRDGGLVFVESRVVLDIDGDGRRLETLVLGGPSTRRGHLDAARATAAADAQLTLLVADALAARFGRGG